MIDKISMKMSLALKRKYPDELPELETINYVHKFLLSNVIPIALILFVAFLADSFYSILVALIGFAVLRAFSGGLHIKKVEACILLSTSIIVLIPILGNYVGEYVQFITISTSILVAIYAPSNIRKQTLIPEKYFLYLKIISVLIVLSNLILENEILSVAFFVQAVTLIRLKGGEKK